MIDFDFPLRVDMRQISECPAEYSFKLYIGHVNNFCLSYEKYSIISTNCTQSLMQITTVYQIDGLMDI